MAHKKTNITKKVLREIQNQNLNPIAVSGTEGIILPNHSGDHSAGRLLRTPSNNTDLVNKQYVDDNAGSLPTTTKGDVIVHNGTTDVRLPIGTNDQVLTADSAQTEGLKWASASGSEWTDTGSVLHPSEETVDNVVIGGTTQANSDISLNVDGSASFNIQKSSAGDFKVSGDTTTNLLFCDASANRVGIGTNTPLTQLDITADGASAVFSFVSHRTASSHGKFDAYGSRGTAASPTALSSGDNMFEIRTLGHDGTSQVAGSRINFTVDGTPTTGNMPSRIEFQTSKTGGSLNTVMTIDSDQKVGVGVANPVEKFAVEGVIQLDEVSAPSATTGYGKIYTATDRRLKFADRTGNRGAVSQTIHSNTTAVGNVGSGEDDLMSFTAQQASYLRLNGDMVVIYAAGQVTSSMMEAGTLKFHFGASSTTLLSSVMSSTHWFAEIKIVKITNTTQKMFITFFDTTGVTSTNNFISAETQNLATDTTIKFTGENGTNTTNNIVTQEYMTIVHHFVN